ncbi:iron-containing alcohol dehydrogenase [Desulfovibrio sp.]|uniref:iron-containing alcohol dehydrogenase n=1 Tax=Desulfovibrio sp. TaxID=885 RepID=UPI003D0C01B7
MVRFTIPREVYFGENALDKLASISGSKAMLVVGSERLKKDGTTAKIQSLLKKAGIESDIFSGIEADPSITTVMKGVAAMNSYNPDWIIGIGGGSPIDAAKAMWIFYEHPDFTFEEAAKPFNLPELRRKARFIAIPTTSGTGTEVTSFSVITDYETGMKYPIADYNITPDIAILDTCLVADMHRPLIADTGMDALTHAIEAYTSTMANPITDGLAIKAIQMIVRDLPASYEGDVTARNSVHLAQCMAGMAFSNAILGVVHSMAHKTGRVLDIAHGRANAIYLTYATQYNARTAPEKYAEIARYLGLEGKTDAALVTALVDCIKKLRSDLNMPSSLKEHGTDEAFFMSHIKEIAKKAVGDPCTGTNPRPVSEEEMTGLFEAVYYGRDVTF